MKKGISLILSLLIVISIITSVPVVVSAANIDDLTFSLNYRSQSYTVTGCSSSINGELVIPFVYDGLPVTRIETDAFHHTEITAVTIPDTVTSIGDNAFMGCTKLVTIIIPDSVTSIGSYAFSGSAYYNDINNWEDGLLYIGNHLIKANNTISGDYVIKENIKTIANYAFSGCTSLKSITIPDSVTSIDDNAFSSCTGLTSITLPDSIINIGSAAFGYCRYLKSITIPDSVISIDDNAFNGCEKLEYVFYNGTEEDKNKITIGSYNYDFIDAIWHYEASGHTYDWLIDIDATCLSKGLCHKECIVCGEALETKEIPAKGHTLGEWEVSTEATCTSSGMKYQRCTDCDAIINIATIPQLKCGAVTLTKVANVTTGVKVYWSKVTGADSYRVYRKTKSSGWKVIGNTTKAYYTDTTAKSGTVYYYSVRAINEAGLGAVCKTTKSLKCLADPTLKAPTSSRSGITLKWTKTTGASGYVIYRKAGNGSWKKLVTEKGVSNLSYVDKTAKKGTTYTYKIRAYYGSTYSAYSNTRQIKDKY